MKRPRFVILFMAVMLLLATISYGLAAEDVRPTEKHPYRDVLQSTFVGGLAGSLLGAAMLAFTKRPGNHLDLVAMGATAGGLLGGGYGVVKATRPLAEVEDGKVKFAMPTIMPDIKESNSKGQTAIVVTAEFLRGSF